ncbi:MAG: hypothetical protein WAW39_08640 [Prosthecobacter sp.]|uniref:hypothetical protein n=1 Tax=Prosthecobacter sp. TaxID=1965333 RepID=UPI003BB0993C
MKTKLLTTLLTLALAFTASAADKDKHEHEAKAGPTGGRLITEVEPHVEFFVNKDKKVEIRFINDDMKVVAPGAQVISVTVGDRSAPTKLSFTKDGDKLVSDKTVPEGNDLPTVVQIRAKEGDKAINEKFNLNLNDCPTCKNKEYACTCAHGEEKEEKKK